MNAALRSLIFATGMAATALAQAHAFLDHADPKVGATVQSSPAEVRLWFNEALEPAFSSIQLLDARGKRVDTPHAQVDAHDRALLRVTLQPLAPGAYTVVWRAVSVDTHVTEGRYTFRVGH